MIIRFELPDGTALNAAMPAPIRQEERVQIDGEQYGAGEIIWQLREGEGEDGPDGDFHGYGFEDREWDQYVVLVKYHVRSVRGDYDSLLIPERRRALL